MSPLTIFAIRRTNYAIRQIEHSYTNCLLLLYIIPISQAPINPPTCKPAGHPAPIILEKAAHQPPFFVYIRLMKTITVFLVAIVITTTSFALSPQQTISEILQTQAAAWNKGDIEAYMKAGYWQSDSLLFIGSKGLTYGFDNTLKNYKRSYPSAEKMGQLRFSQLQFKPIADDHYFVIGRWELKRKGGDLSGYFTLLFQKIDGNWRIVADHSS